MCQVSWFVPRPFICLLAAVLLLLLPVSSVAQPAGRLVLSPSEIHFGNVVSGQSKNLSCTVTNSGTASVTVSRATVSDSTFSVTELTLPIILGPGASVTFTVRFAPLALQHWNANVIFASNASDPSPSLLVHGTGVPAGTLAANPASLQFRGVHVGSSETLSVNVTNIGYTNVQITRETAAGTGFSLRGLTLPLTLPPAGSVTFNVIFAPSAGNHSGSVSLASNATNPSLRISLSGVGLPPGTLAISSTSLHFGQVRVGAKELLPTTLSAVGGRVIVASATTNNPVFAVRGATFPLTIHSGQSALVYIRLRPQSVGLEQGTASFQSNALNESTVPLVSLRGHGIPQHQVMLDWDASPGAVGYNTYRSTASNGGFTRMNATPDTSTSYTDSSVLGGQTYYYVVTSLNSSGAESAYSNEVAAAVPSP